MLKSFSPSIGLITVFALGMTTGCSPREKANTDFHLAPDFAEVFARSPEEFDSQFAGKIIEIAGLVKNRSEENPSPGKRYLVLWGFKAPNHADETVVHCEYIPEFEAVPAIGRVKVRGKVLPYAEGNGSATLADCQLLGIRKPLSNKAGDSPEDGE
jgi:hypothetical protein